MIPVSESRGTASAKGTPEDFGPAKVQHLRIDARKEQTFEPAPRDPGRLRGQEEGKGPGRES